MNESADRLLADWLNEGPDRGPMEGLQRTLAATRRTSQRPAWRVHERWIPMQLLVRPAFVPRPLYLLVVAALLAALVGALIIVGSRQPPAPPFGLAGNGMIALDLEGELWLANSDGSKARPLDLRLGLSYSPVFSPDGTRIAFLSREGDHRPWSVIVANADGTNPMNVTGDMKVVTSPGDGLAWSPTGSQLVFTSSDRGRDRLYVVGADGSGLRPITDSVHDRNWPSWSPNGEWIVYQLRRSDTPRETHLAIGHPDGSGERQLLAAPVSYEPPFAATQWSADSQRLAYSRPEGSANVVGVIDLTGHEVLVSRPGPNAFYPVWSPDAGSLAFLTDGGGVAVIDPDNPSDRLSIPKGLGDCGVTFAPDSTALLGVGDDCTSLYRIPLADPASALRIALPSGDIGFVAWQRTAP
jgi:hypothetical protein